MEEKEVERVEFQSTPDMGCRRRGSRREREREDQQGNKDAGLDNPAARISSNWTKIARRRVRVLVGDQRDRKEGVCAFWLAR